MCGHGFNPLFSLMWLFGGWFFRGEVKDGIRGSNSYADGQKSMQGIWIETFQSH